MTLSAWQKMRLSKVHAKRTEYAEGRADVTVLAYHFWRKDGYNEAFARVECAIRETWLHCGQLKTVVVTNFVGDSLRRFAESFPCVDIQVEPTLEPGRIFTMSVDCNGRLHTRFSTPYVLIVQNDGFPLRSGLDDFIGKWDFIGAPYVRDIWWKRLVSRILNYHVMNGGFSLRSHEICERAAYYWEKRYRTLPDCIDVSEDLFYTQTLILNERTYRRAARLPDCRTALSFSWDANVPIVRPSTLPFGFHGAKAFEKSNLTVDGCAVMTDVFKRHELDVCM